MNPIFGQQVEISLLVWANDRLRYLAIDDLENQLALDLRKNHGFIAKKVWWREGVITPETRIVKVFLYAA